MRRIILDTDPGIDDALALFLALASPEVQLEAVTTVSGNVDVALTTYNALTLLELAGRTDIPVARGCDRPLIRQPFNAAIVHGDNGLGGLQLPEPSIQPLAEHAIGVIIEKVMAAPGEITLVAIGPLTNIPLVSLDVTTQTQMQREQVQMLTRSESPVMRAIKQMLDYSFDVFGPAYGVGDFQMHDPLCLAAAFQPDLITWDPVYVDVELHGTLTLGETVAYFRRPGAPPPNVLASVGVDADRFIQLFLRRIEERFP